MHKDLEATTISDARAREITFAKLLTVDAQQVLVHLYRDENDALALIVQLWVARTDEQLRVQIDCEDDEKAMILFNDLSDESIELVLQELGVPAMIAEIEDHD